METKSLSEINEYTGIAVNPLSTPEKYFELYSVPSFDNQMPETVQGKLIGSTKISVMEDDVLICKINPRINRVWVVKHTTPHTLIASSEWIVVRNHQMNSHYLMWYFSSDSFRTLMNAHVAGIGGSLTRAQPKQVAKYPVPIPQRNEQNQIAQILDTLHALILQRKQQLEKLDLLVKAQFVEMFDVEEFTTVGNVCRLINGDRGKNYPSGADRVDSGVPFINAGHLDGRKVCFDSMDYVTPEKYFQMTQGKVQKDDILYCLRGSLGKHALVDFDEGLIASSLVIIRCDQQKMLPQFMLCALESPEVEKQLRGANNGTSQPNLSAASVKNYKIPLPTIEKQEAFVELFKQVDKSKSAVQRSLDQLETLQKALMQKYFG